MSNYKWSFSSLKEYVNCPKQYQEVKVLKRYFKQTTPEMTYGNEVHKALENYVKDGTPLVKNYSHFKPLMDTIIEIEGEKFPEQRMALDKDGNACKYSEGWVRGSWTCSSFAVTQATSLTTKLEATSTLTRNS